MSENSASDSGESLRSAGFKPVRLSETLNEVLHELRDGCISIRELERSLHGRGFAILIMLLAIPFTQPIPLPFLSTPFGLAIALLGFRIACGQRPWLPAFILDRQISSKILHKIIRAAIKAAVFLERFIKPRMHFLQRWPGMQNLVGIVIMLAGLILALPLPVPLTNMIPGLAVICLTIGLMERDGALVLVGYGFGALALAYVGLIAALGKNGVEALVEQVWPG